MPIPEIPPEAIQLAYLIGVSAVATKPFLKFIETISPALGRAYKPLEMILEAKAQVKVDKIKALGELEIKEAVEKRVSGISATLEERASDRAEFTQNREQNNLEDMFQKVPQFLPGEVSDEKVSEDWFFQFVGGAKSVSDEEMQILWAKILAGEITQPGSYSFRTLNTLKHLTKKEAETFMKVGKLAMIENRLAYVLNHPRTSNPLFVKFGVSLDEILLMKEIGLITSEILSVGYVSNERPRQFFLHYASNPLKVVLAPSSAHNFNAEVFTQTGRELLPLIEAKPNKEYIEYFQSLLNKTGELKYEMEEPS
jgi:uncharacterized repeat protein (TIGR03899 family)